MIERAIGKKPPKKPKPEEIETVPDAWERFEKIIGKIVPPKHKSTDKGGTTGKRKADC